MRKIFWTCLNILAPEFLLAHAIDHWIWAHESVKILKEHGIKVEEGTSWWRWLFQYCGWRKSSGEGAAGTQEKPDPHSKSSLTLKHCYYGNMGGFLLEPDTAAYRSRVQKLKSAHVAEFPVTMAELVEYLKEEASDPSSSNPTKNIEEALNRVGLTKADIKDKDKADFFTRIIAVFQICWLVLTVCTRKVRRLATTQLEIVTLGFAGCAVLTYCFHWNKPQNVLSATGIKVPFRKVLAKKDSHPLTFLDIMMHNSQPERRRDRRLYNDIVRPTQSPPLDMLTLLVIIMLVIGSVHLLAWNFAFPTPVERFLWRTAALLTVGTPIVLQLCVSTLPVILAWPFSWYNDRKVPKRAQNFALVCIEAMNDYDAQMLNGERPFAGASEMLETGDVRHYKDIITGDARAHLKNLCDFIEKNSKYGESLPDINKQFARLTKIILDRRSEHRHGWWQLFPKSWNRDPEYDEVDRTDRFPRYTRRRWGKVIRLRMMQYSFPIIGIIYSLSRLTIILLAFSAFRRAPKSVYYTAWTKYIPVVQ
jgi:hypothetical protein